MKRRNIPTKIQFTPTNICNAKCIFCVYKSVKEKRELMDFSIFKKAVDDFVDIWGKEVFLCPTLWEILIDPNIYEKNDYLKSKSIKVEVLTNWFLLLTHFKRLIDSKPDFIAISFWDIDPQNEAEIFGVSEDLAKNKIEWIKKLLEYNKEIWNPTKIMLAFRSMRSYGKIIHDSRFKVLDNYKLEYDLPLWYDNRWGRVQQKDLKWIMQLRTQIRFKKYPCANLNTINILPNGDVRLCACRVYDTMYDDLVIGNIKDFSLKEILHNEKTKEIRKWFAKGMYPKTCNKCTMYAPYF